jgi:hypothetical protein
LREEPTISILETVQKEGEQEKDSTAEDLSVVQISD